MGSSAPSILETSEVFYASCYSITASPFCPSATDGVFGKSLELATVNQGVYQMQQKSQAPYYFLHDEHFIGERLGRGDKDGRQHKIKGDSG